MPISEAPAAREKTATGPPEPPKVVELSLSGGRLGRGGGGSGVRSGRIRCLPAGILRPRSAGIRCRRRQAVEATQISEAQRVRALVEVDNAGADAGRDRAAAEILAHPSRVQRVTLGDQGNLADILDASVLEFRPECMRHRAVVGDQTIERDVTMRPGLQLPCERRVGGQRSVFVHRPAFARLIEQPLIRGGCPR